MRRTDWIRLRVEDLEIVRGLRILEKEIVGDESDIYYIALMYMKYISNHHHVLR